MTSEVPERGTPATTVMFRDMDPKLSQPVAYELPITRGCVKSPVAHPGALTIGMSSEEAIAWLRQVDGQLYRNQRHPSGREAWVAVVRTPRAAGRRGKLIVALGGTMEEAANAAAGQWEAVWQSYGAAH